MGLCGFNWFGLFVKAQQLKNYKNQEKPQKAPGMLWIRLLLAICVVNVHIKAVRATMSVEAFHTHSGLACSSSTPMSTSPNSRYSKEIFIPTTVATANNLNSQHDRNIHPRHVKPISVSGARNSRLHHCPKKRRNRYGWIVSVLSWEKADFKGGRLLER